MKYKINKQKCTGCRFCINKCPGATEIKNNKAVIADQEKLEQCGGESVCPLGAIEEIGKKGKESVENRNEEFNQYKQQTINRGFGMGQGRGMGAGRGRGLGIGPRDGRGGGRGLGKR